MNNNEKYEYNARTTCNHKYLAVGEKPSELALLCGGKLPQINNYILLKEKIQRTTVQNIFDIMILYLVNTTSFDG